MATRTTCSVRRAPGRGESDRDDDDDDDDDDFVDVVDGDDDSTMRSAIGDDDGSEVEQSGRGEEGEEEGEDEDEGDVDDADDHGAAEDDDDDGGGGRTLRVARASCIAGDCIMFHVERDPSGRFTCTSPASHTNSPATLGTLFLKPDPSSRYSGSYVPVEEEPFQQMHFKQPRWRGLCTASTYSTLAKAALACTSLLGLNLRSKHIVEPTCQFCNSCSSTVQCFVVEDCPPIVDSSSLPEVFYSSRITPVVTTCCCEAEPSP